MIGQVISHYEVLDYVGGGGMGVVYKAKDILLDRIVALKFLAPESSRDGTANRRFMQEARAASALDHPNICPVYEIGETRDGRLFIAMAFNAGATLGEVRESRRMTVEEVVRIGMQVASGLDAAHRAGIVHRDIKPANVMMGESGDVRIVDFGVAKLADSVERTSPGITPGTTAFMSPEQLRGDSVDARTDIWSLGALLYYLLTGAKPFEGQYASAIIYAITSADPTPPRELNPEIPGSLEAVILKCLEKDADLRYSSAAELVAELESVNDPAVEIRQVRTKRKAIAVLLLLVFVFVAAAALIPQLRYRVFPALEPTPTLHGLAVLPFVAVADDAANRSLIDGLVHSVSGKLDGISRFEERLWVVPSTEVYRRDIDTAEEAAHQLHVQLVVTGSVLIDDDDVRMTLYLVDAATGRSIRSRTIEEPFADVAGLEDSIVEVLAELLAVEVRPEVREILIAGGTSVSDAYLYYIRGQGYLQNSADPDGVDRAIPLFERAIAADSGYVLAVAGLAQAYWWKYTYTHDRVWADAAIDHAEEALRRNDHLAPVHLAYGFILSGTGRPREAESSFRRALEIEPAYVSAMIGLARSLALQDSTREAEAIYKTAIAVKPERWVLYYDLGALYHGEARYEEAAGQFEQVTVLAPDFADGYIMLAVVKHQLDQIDEARALYEKATTVEPDNPRSRAIAFNNLGVIEYSRGRFEDAAQWYRNSLALDSLDLDGWSNLGNSYHWLGRDSEAGTAWRHAAQLALERLEVNPQSTYALETLAMSYAKLGRVEEALSAIGRLLDLPRVDSGTHLTIGKAYEVIGDRESALEHIGRALAMGHSRSAVENNHWLDSLRLDPEYRSIAARPAQQ
jgi:serine/threonine-protein kinase